MKKHLSILFFIAIYFIVPVHLSAQTDTVINGKRYKMVEEKKLENGKYIAPLDSMFVINNKKFKYYNTWLTAGAGWQQNLTYKRKVGFAGGLDFNFHIKQYYWQLGTIITGEKFGFYNNYQFHLGYGKRFEDKDIHFAGFVGISYSRGRGMVDSIYVRPYSQPGLYLQAEIIKKVAYDVGIGGSLFADWNQEQTMLGFRFIIYFSSAYKGKKNEDYRNN